MNGLKFAKNWIQKRLSLSDEIDLSAVGDLELDTKYKSVTFSAYDPKALPYIQPENDDISSEYSDEDLDQEQEIEDQEASLPDAYSYDSLTSTEADFVVREPVAADAHCSRNYLNQCKALEVTRTSEQPLISTAKIFSFAVSAVSVVAETFYFATKPVVAILPEIQYPHAIVYAKSYFTDIIDCDPETLDFLQIVARMTVYGPWILNNQSMDPVYSQFADPMNLTKCMVYIDGRDNALMLEKMSFGFSACTWLLPYELGAANAIQTAFRSDVLWQYSFIGSQTGVVPAIALALNLDTEAILNEFTTAALKQSQTFFRGASTQIADVLAPILEKFVPQDISSLGSRLTIVCSEFPSGQERRVSEFPTRADLINTALASCSLPIIGKHSIKIDDKTSLVSNQFSKKQHSPVIDNLTITVQPFHGLANIRPESQLYAPDSVWRCSNQQLAYLNMFEDGYRNSEDFLKGGKKACILSPLFFKSPTYCKSQRKEVVSPSSSISLTDRVFKALRF